MNNLEIKNLLNKVIGELKSILLYDDNDTLNASFKIIEQISIISYHFDDLSFETKELKNIAYLLMKNDCTIKSIILKVGIEKTIEKLQEKLNSYEEGKVVGKLSYMSVFMYKDNFDNAFNNVNNKHDYIIDDKNISDANYFINDIITDLIFILKTMNNKKSNILLKELENVNKILSNKELFDSITADEGALPTEVNEFERKEI